MALVFCSTDLISSKFWGVDVEFFSRSSWPYQTCGRGMSLCGSESVFFKCVSSSCLCADRELGLGCWKSSRANWYGSLKNRFWVFFLWICLILAVSTLLNAECFAYKPHQSSCSPLFSSSVTVFICFFRFFFCLRRVSISRCLLLFCDFVLRFR